MALRAIVAGATGLIGSNLAGDLVSKGSEVYGVARAGSTSFVVWKDSPAIPQPEALS